VTRPGVAPDPSTLRHPVEPAEWSRPDGSGNTYTDADLLPPARGRTFLTLEPDGSASRRAPGRDDRRVRSEGRWEVAGERLLVSFGDQDELVFDVVSAEPGRLALRPQTNHE
jgi:hypothetical protein